MRDALDDWFHTVNRYASVVLTIPLATLCVSCASKTERSTASGSADQKASSSEIHLTKFEPREQSAHNTRSPSLCNLVKDYRRAAGVFEVRDIIQRPESEPGKTFVNLGLKRSWYKSSELPDPISVVLYEGPVAGAEYESNGGPYPALSKGQTIGVLLKTISPPYNNRQTKVVTLFKTSTFVPKDGGQGYTNGWLFKDEDASLSEIGTKVRDMNKGITSNNGCPYDVEPSE